MAIYLTNLSFHKEIYSNKFVATQFLKDSSTNKNLLLGYNHPNFNNLLPHQELCHDTLSKLQRNHSLTNKQPTPTQPLVQQVISLLDSKFFPNTHPFNLNSSQNPISIQQEHIFFKKHSDYLNYIQYNFLEVGCNEAPFLSLSYDHDSGLDIPIYLRIGSLNRKLRIISDIANSEIEWLSLSAKALESSYAFDLSGINVILARYNTLNTIADSYKYLFKKELASQYVNHFSIIIAENITQGDPITLRKPFYVSQNNQLTQTIHIRNKELGEPLFISFLDWKTNQRLFLNDLNINQQQNLHVVADLIPITIPENNPHSDTLPLIIKTLFSLAPASLSLITHSDWTQKDSLKHKQVRQLLINDPSLNTLKDFKKASDIYPNFENDYGISIIHLDAYHSGPCSKSFKHHNSIIESHEFLRDIDIFHSTPHLYIRNPRHLTITRKIFLNSNQNPLSSCMAFPQEQNIIKLHPTPSKPYSVSFSYSTDHNSTHPRTVLFDINSFLIKQNPSPNTPFFSSPLTIFQAQSLISFLQTKTVRFLIASLANDSSLHSLTFSTIPIPSLHKTYSDQDLFQKYNLSTLEQQYINQSIANIS